MSTSVGTLFVEIVSKGFAKVQADADAVKKSLQGVDPVAKTVIDRLDRTVELKIKPPKIPPIKPVEIPTVFGPNDGPQISKWQRFKADTRESYNAPSRLPAPLRAVKAVVSGGVGGMLGRGIESRYGPGWGKALKYANAGLMAMPLPGAHPIGMAAMLAAAEGHRAISKMIGKRKAPVDKADPVQVPVQFAPPKTDKLTKNLKPVTVPVKLDATRLQQ